MANRTYMKKNIIQPTVIDLFCGAGGLSCGFRDAGFAILAGIDNWEDAITTYSYNFPNTTTLCKDIENITKKEKSTIIGNHADNIDVIIGGPPCQGFSVSGKRLMNDSRNKLYKAFVSLVSYYKPKLFVMENVPGVMRLFNGKIKEQIIADFTAIGYNVTTDLLSAENYGVPQQRKRIFFVGINPKKIKNTKLFEFPQPTHGSGLNLLPFVTVKDAISDLDFILDDIALDECIDYFLPAVNDYQKVMRKKSKKLYNHVAVIHNKRTKEIIAMVPDGGNYKCLPKKLWEIRKVNIAWTRMNSSRPCFTIDTGHNHHFHYKENRVPTVRESARIQSFSDTFLFFGIKTSQFRQVGNAVPPMLVKALADKIYLVLGEG
ncbi:MAG: DNA cytosine methyltransferase [Treponema sp.]|jgi:DNA (cytosine-5)-methyltransferase 1|nr:DNA cytosine methyltransferase [Treponema sp.]